MRLWIPRDVQMAQLGLLLAVLGLCVGMLAWSRPFRILERRLFQRINRLPPQPVLDWLMWSVTHLGSPWCGLAVLTGAIVLQEFRLGLVVALALITGGILIGVSKSLTGRTRPFKALSGVRVIGLRPADLSYPSGHSVVAFTLATLLASGLPLGPAQSLVLYLLAGAVAYSRVHLGVHYPLDVLSGMTIGIGWGLLWASYLYR